jgi:hypothetical protein
MNNRQMIMTDKRGGWKIYRKSDPEKKTPEYKAWFGMNTVCRGLSGKQNKKYYKDKGITVCEDWLFIHGDPNGNNLRYSNFLVSVGRRPEGKKILGRVNKLLGFTPDNTRWMDVCEQQRSKTAYRKFSYSRDEELIKELQRRGYEVVGY